MIEPFILIFSFTLFINWIAYLALGKIFALDRPSLRKIHQKEIPQIGGFVFSQPPGPVSNLQDLHKCQETKGLKTKMFTLRCLIIVQGGLITSTGVVLVVLVLVFVVPGAVLVVIDVVD